MVKGEQNMRLHIVWMHSHFLYWMGGTKFIYEVVRKIKEQHKVTMFVENASVMALKNYEKIGVQVVTLNGSTSTSAMYWLTLEQQLKRDVKAFETLVSNLKKEDKQVVLVSNMFPMNVVASRLQLPHVQYIFEPFAFFHDPDFVSKFPVLKRLFVSYLKYRHAELDVKATKQADQILTLNNTTRKYINDIYGKDSVVTYAGINSDHFRPYVSKELQKKYKGKKILVHSTDYTPVKGTDRMIRIFARVKEQETDAHLLITSTLENKQVEGELKKLARELGVNSSVEFLGFVDYDLLPQLYSLAYALVQCSFSERSGTTSMALPVKEALACGTWPIRYPIEGEDVEDGVTGYLVDPRNEDEMVEKIVQVLGMKQKDLTTAGKKGRELAKKKFTWEQTAEVIQKEIKKVARK